MGRKPQDDATDTELGMLRILWDRGEATRRQVADALYPGGGESHYSTVQKLLERLEKKGFAAHDRRDGVLVFRPIVDRDEFLRRRLQGLAEKLCGGAVAPLVMTLVRSQPMSAAEVAELEAWLRDRRQGRAPTDPTTGGTA